MLIFALHKLKDIIMSIKITCLILSNTQIIIELP